MDSLAVTLLPPEDCEENFYFLYPTSSMKYYVGVKETHSANCIIIYNAVDTSLNNSFNLQRIDCLLKPSIQFYIHSKAISSVDVVEYNGCDYVIAVSIDGLLSLCNITEKRIERVVSLNQENGCDKILVDVHSKHMYVSSTKGSLCIYHFPDMHLESSIINKFHNPLCSLQLDGFNSNQLYSLDSEGILNVWDISNQRITLNTRIPVESSTSHPSSSNKLLLLGDTTYLVLFNGNLFYWDTLTLHVQCCQHICNTATHFNLHYVKNCIKDQAVIFVLYYTPQGDVLLGYPLAQFSPDAETSTPLYHVSYGFETETPVTIQNAVVSQNAMILLYFNEKALFASIYNTKQIKVLPPSSIRESFSSSNHSRSSGSFGSIRISEGFQAEHFETVWDRSGFTDRLQTIIRRDEQEHPNYERCNCQGDAESALCEYGDCLVLHPMITRPVCLTPLNGPNHILPLPIVHPTNKPVVVTVAGDGLIEVWRLDTLMRTWFLDLYDPVTFITCTPFSVVCKGNSSPSEDAFNSPSWISQNPGSVVDKSFGSSFSFSEDSLFPPELSLPSTHYDHSYVNLQELDKADDNNLSLSRLLIVGTQSGHLYILDEESGHILFDALIMNGSLDQVLVSKLYCHKENDNLHAGFVLTCINYNSHIFFSLLLSYSSMEGRLTSISSADLSAVTKKSDSLSEKSTSTLLDQASQASTDSFTTMSHILTVSSDSQEINYLSDSMAGYFYCDPSIPLNSSIFYDERDVVDQVRICIPVEKKLLLFTLQGQQDLLTHVHQPPRFADEEEIIAVKTLPMNIFYHIHQFTSPQMKPLLAVELPYLEILTLLDELSRFLSNKGLVQGWSRLPVTVHNKTVSWSTLIQYMNPILPWNQDSLLNKQLMKLLSIVPCGVTLENPLFHVSKIHSGLLEYGGPPALRKEEQIVESLIVLKSIASNDEGSMFLKFFTINREMTSLMFLYLFSLASILSSLSKLVSIGDGLTVYLTSLLHNILHHTEKDSSHSSLQPKQPFTFHRSQRTPSSPQSTYPNTSDILHSIHSSLHGIDIRIVAEFCFNENSPCFRQASEKIIHIVINEFTKNNWSLLPIVSTLMEELRKEVALGKSNRFYSILLSLMYFIQDEKMLKSVDSEFLLSVITSVLFDEHSPAILYDKLLLCYLLLYRDSENAIADITQVIQIIFERTVPNAELISAVFSLIPDLFITQLVSILKQNALVLKGVRALSFLLKMTELELTPFADILLEALIFAKNQVLKENFNDLQFLSKINIPNIANKTITYNDVKDDPRDHLYYSILSCILLLSRLPTIFIDNHYAFTVSSNGILRIFSLSFALPLCSASIHNGACNKLKVFTQKSSNTSSTLNRKQDYFILSFSRQDRLMAFYLFSDSNIPMKSIVRQFKNNRFTFKDYSGVSLMKIALLFIPCNSNIQPESCSLCRRHKKHNYNSSDFFIFHEKTIPGIRSESTHARALPNYTMEDLDFTSLQLGTILYGKEEPIDHDIQPLMSDMQRCWVCDNQVSKSTLPRKYCCCKSMDIQLVTPQSLMPTSFSQDCFIQGHLPPTSLTICRPCLNSILCGNQSLSQSELTSVPTDREFWSARSTFIPHDSSSRYSQSRTGGVSLSVLLAHIGHNVDDLSLDKDFQLTIQPWNGKEGKRPDAFRIYLQLTDMVMVWYDVLVKGIHLYECL